MAIANDRLREIVALLQRRPGHPVVAANVNQLLIEGIGASPDDVHFEQQIREVRGRADSLLGYTIFEFKSNLGRELGDAESQLLRYLPQREQDTGERCVGIATDGAQWRVYDLRRGELRLLGERRTNSDDPHDLLNWLSGAVELSAGRAPTPEVVRDVLGRQSLAWMRARDDLEVAWASVADHPDVRLWRDLWAERIALVYGQARTGSTRCFSSTLISRSSRRRSRRMSSESG